MRVMNNALKIAYLNYISVWRKHYFKKKSTVSSTNNLKKVQSSWNCAKKDQTLQIAELLKSWILEILGFVD